MKILAAMLGIETVRIRHGRVTLHYNDQRQLTRPEIEAFRRATDQPLEFSLFNQTVITIDLGQVDEDRRLNHLRGILAKI